VRDETLFLSTLPVIDQVTRQVCRRHRMTGTEAEDFASDVRLHFLQHDCQVLRRFEGRSRLTTYINVVIQRLYLDYRNRQWGRWRPSAEAKRLGPTAILFERYITRDGWTCAQAIEMLKVNHHVAAQEIDLLVARLSPSASGRESVSELEADKVEGPSRADANVVRAEYDFLAKRIHLAFDRARRELSAEDALVLKMRFEDGLAVVDIARALHRDQKRLYRTIERILTRLRKSLEAEGISRAEVATLLADRFPASAEPEPPSQLVRLAAPGDRRLNARASGR
jgi:RNA polymerase sigma factor (sigma-70 family)